MVRQRHYRSYLLRLWRVSGEETCAWRAMLESPSTGERRGFASLDDLCAWIKAQAAELDCNATPHGDRQGVE